MENLTRNNYEIWFLDYLDGQLSNEQLDTLLDFLEQNPDLKEELHGVSGMALPVGTDTLGGKESLLKTDADIPGIAALDQLCIARMENDLSDEEARQFDNSVENEPELKRTFAAFNLTRLNPADKVIYPYKSELRKKTIVFTPWLITAISSAAILLLVWFLWPDKQQKDTPAMAKLETPATTSLTPSTDTLHPSPSTLHPSPSTLHPSPNTLNPAPNTHSSPYTLNPAPNTLNPAPNTHSSPNTLNPAPNTHSSSSRETSPINALFGRPLTGPRIPDPQSVRILYASNYPSAISNISIPDDAMTVPQYALQLFREKILGQDVKQVKKTRFSMWEVAGAGVNKINSLAGTQMKLNREYDSKGDLLAVSFNSRLLDVEAPVRAR